MARFPLFNRLSTRLTAAFVVAAVLGVVMVAMLAYRSTSSEFNTFLSHMESMEGMMGAGMMTDMMGGVTLTQAAGDFLGNLRQTLWIAGTAGVIVAILLGALFTRLIVAPLGKVSAAAGRVARGDFSQKVDIGGSGELEELGQSFNSMAVALKRDQELRRNMIADIAHELRTPLTVLRGNVEAMLDGVLSPDKDNLSSLHQETLLLARLVDDLRTLSLADAGQLKFELQAADLKVLSSQVIDGFQTQLTARKQSVKLEAPKELPEAWADPERTSQVLRNLLNNAMQYSPEGGSITVKLHSGAGAVTVSVIDTGTGIPAEDLSHVFDRFYRVDRSRTRSTGGSGLGLAIVKQLVESQGGEVRAESTHGKGSTFSFRLPIVRPSHA
ncbi:MAG: HAMP domain-containing protein [Chloroflexi bacterium]|nr:HAMP domain-containing protein [Chloroflexota bacterium]